MPALEKMQAWLDEPQREAQGKIEKAVLWQYPGIAQKDMPMKLTASGLLRELEGPAQIAEMAELPAFLQDEKKLITGAARGSAYHRALQVMDVAGLRELSGAALSKEISRRLDLLLERGLLDEAQRRSITAKKLAAFFEGEVGVRLLAAKNVHREWAFNVFMNVQEALLPEEARPQDRGDILVQGVIDLCFEEDGQWVLVDYKTDWSDDLEEIRQRYASQLGIYALALARITKMPVKQKCLCLISRGETLWM